MIPFQSCDLNDDLLDSNEKISINAEYLDTDVSNTDSLTEQQKEILKKAKTRIDTFVVYKNKSYKLEVSSGSQIQMSERVFKFFETKLNNTNTLIKKLNVVSCINDPKKLRIVNKESITNAIILRCKNGNYENDEGDYVEIPLNSTTCTISWSGIDFYISNDDLNLLAYGTALGTLIPGLDLYCAVSAATFYYWASKYPDGAILTFDSLTGLYGGGITEQTQNGTW